MTVVSRLTQDPIVAEAELGRFMASLSDAGAVVTFSGVARGATREGEKVEALHLDHYPGMTEGSLEQIAQEGAARFEVRDVFVIHRCGTIRPGEVIVFVATASPHRRAAFLAADYLMDRLKTEAVFWKKEQGVDAERWIEPTDEDRADRDRWR
jgi:molybdopterin synthase catalytic subunit